MTFVEVDDALVRLIKAEAKGRTIIDCGAGRAMLGKMLPGVVSLDLYPDEDSLSPVTPFDAREWEFIPEHLPVFLRPDHSGWVDEVLQGKKFEATTALYVGLAHNILTDLPARDYAYSVTSLVGWEGKDGERVYCIEIRGAPPKKVEFLLVRDKVYEMSTWVRKHRSGMYCNMAGGRSPTDIYDVVKTVWAFSFDQLDWRGTWMDPEESDAGWLDRNGKFYPCQSQDHDVYAELILHKTVYTLEKLGWVRVSNAHDWSRGATNRITPEQARWLDRNGHHVPEEDLP